MATDAEAEALIHQLHARDYRIEAIVEQEAVGRLATVRLTFSSGSRAPGIEAKRSGTFTEGLRIPSRKRSPISTTCGPTSQWLPEAQVTGAHYCSAKLTVTVITTGTGWPLRRAGSNRH